MIVVTGGAGFIGSALVARLNADGVDQILVVDERGSAVKDRNLAALRYTEYLDKAEFIDRVKSDQLPTGIRAIVHLGACSSTTERNWDYLLATNVKYTQDLCSYALKKGARFIYASSGATYGAGAEGYSDSDEVTPTLKPLNLYGRSKQIVDQWMLDQGLVSKVAGLKFFNVFGPNEYHKGEMRSVVHKAYQQIKASGSVKLFKSYRPEFKDGEQRRDFIYVKDCTEVMSWLLQNPAANGIFNLGTGMARTWVDLVSAIFAALGSPPNIEFIEMPEDLRAQYQYFTEARMEKLAATGCPMKLRSLEEGIREYVLNYLETASPYLTETSLTYPPHS